VRAANKQTCSSRAGALCPRMRRYGVQILTASGGRIARCKPLSGGGIEHVRLFIMDPPRAPAIDRSSNTRGAAWVQGPCAREART